MKITKRIRDEAILICAIAASGAHPLSVTDVVVLLSDATRNEAQKMPSARLAVKAWAKATTGSLFNTSMTTLREAYALAAQLLTEGWSP